MCLGEESTLGKFGAQLQSDLVRALAMSEIPKCKKVILSYKAE
jgi:hypothetical protein